MSIVKFVLVLGLFGPLVLNTAVAESSRLSSASNPVSLYKDALSYLLGRNGKPKSPEKAAALFKSLAEQNWSSAQHMLGNLYYRGKGVEKNDLLAYKWLSIAARNDVKLAEAIYHKRKRLQSRLSSEHLEQVEAWIANWEPEQDLALRN
jgi:TPR repeat protein